MRVIIFGIDGFIGKSLYKKCVEEGIDVVGTSRRQGKGLFFELGVNNPNEIFNSIDYSTIDYAVIAAGITSIKECRDNREYTYRVNVLATTELMRCLRERGIRIIYLSSDVVFDGKDSNYKENDPVNPLCEYGRQKVEVEEYLQKNDPDSLIYRLSKQYESNLSGRGLLADIYHDYINKGCVRCIKGLRFNPTYVENTVKAIVLGMKRNLTGLFHVASPEAISRYEVSMALIDSLGLDISRISEESYDKFGFEESKAIDTSMNVSKFIEISGGDMWDPLGAMLKKCYAGD